MAVDSISSLTANATAQAKISSKDLNDQFLKLLVTQLKNQDPLNPIENNQFVSELAQLQALDQSVKLASTNQSLLLQSSLATGSSMIGKNVSGLVTTNGVSSEVSGLLSSIKVENQNVIYNVLTADGSVKTINPSDILTVAPAGVP